MDLLLKSPFFAHAPENNGVLNLLFYWEEYDSQLLMLISGTNSLAGFGMHLYT